MPPWLRRLCYVLVALAVLAAGFQAWSVLPASGFDAPPVAVPAGTRELGTTAGRRRDARTTRARTDGDTRLCGGASSWATRTKAVPTAVSDHAARCRVVMYAFTIRVLRLTGPR